MRSQHIHPGWEILIYLVLAGIGVGFTQLGGADPASACTVIV